MQINNGAGATLNRVTGPSPSTIAGSLTSTGSTYLINENGVVVMPTGNIVTGGSFVASTRNTGNDAFMAGGNLQFTGTSSDVVTNQGSITSNTGDVVLIGKSVSNSGRISAAKGTAGIVAGDDVLLQPSGTGLQIRVASGSGDATSGGAILSAQAIINAAGGNAYALAGNNGGLVRATGTTTIAGHVWLSAGGTAQVRGTLQAQNADGSGGAIDVQGTDILVSGTLNVVTNIPSSSSDCAVGGTSNVYELNVCTAAPVAVDNSSASASAIAGHTLSNASAAVGYIIVRLPSGALKMITTTADGSTITTGVTPATSTAPHRAGWRQVGDVPSKRSRFSSVM